MSAGSGFHSLFFLGGSGQHCPWIAFDNPSSILPGMDPYHGAAICSSAHQPHHLRLVRVRGGGKALLWAVCLPTPRRGKGPCWTCLRDLK